jgi:anaerobic nitric oxide reductase transcription regulator
MKKISALPDSIIESELFGHKKGAFTGALTDRLGAFLQCTQGTLFLDEIGELNLENQAKLLRTLENSEIKQ